MAPVGGLGDASGEHQEARSFPPRVEVTNAGGLPGKVCAVPALNRIVESAPEHR